MKIIRTVPIKTAPRQAIQFPSLASLQSRVGLLSKLWSWLKEKQRTHSKALRLEESLSLGQKRFVAVIQVNGERYLVGGGAADVALLTKLDKAESFGDYLQQAPAEVLTPARKPRKRAQKPKVQKCA